MIPTRPLICGGLCRGNGEDTFFAYEELLAFKCACKTLGLTKRGAEDIMYNNAMNLIRVP